MDQRCEKHGRIFASYEFCVDCLRENGREAQLAPTTALPTAETACEKLKRREREARKWHRTLYADELAEYAAFITAQAAEIERLTKERDRLTSHPVDYRYWEGRYRDEATRAEAAEASLAAVTAERDAMRAAACVDKQTAQILLSLLNPLHGALDLQTYDERYKQGFDAPKDAEYEVTVTAQMERDIQQAVVILERRLSDAALSTDAQGEK